MCQASADLHGRISSIENQMRNAARDTTQGCGSETARHIEP
jgi:hypothetical protein